MRDSYLTALRLVRTNFLCGNEPSMSFPFKKLLLLQNNFNCNDYKKNEMQRSGKK